MGFEKWFGGGKSSEPPEQNTAEEIVPERDMRSEREKGSVKAEMRFTFFNRPQRVTIGGDSLNELADKVGAYMVKLEMGPSNSVASNFSIDIPEHPEINDFDSLMQHGTKVEE